jgi:uncharacterized coiled-coil protein SlyX
VILCEFNKLTSSHVYIKLKEINDKLIEEQHMYDQAKEQLTALEKKNSHIRTELDELKSVYDKVR